MPWQRSYRGMRKMWPKLIVSHVRCICAICGWWAHKNCEMMPCLVCAMKDSLDVYIPIRLAQWASYQIRKIAGCACAGNAGNVFPQRRIQRKTRVSDPGMHHGTCVTHMPWCMSGLLTRGGGGNVPGIPGACAPATLRIWQEAHEAN